MVNNGCGYVQSMVSKDLIQVTNGFTYNNFTKFSPSEFLPFTDCSSWSEAHDATKKYLQQIGFMFFKNNVKQKAVSLSDYFKSEIQSSIVFDKENASSGCFPSACHEGTFKNFKFSCFASFNDFNKGFGAENPPMINQFRSIARNVTAVKEVLRIGSNTWNGRLITLHEQAKLENIVLACTKYWHVLDKFERDCLLHYIVGFEDKIDNDKITKNEAEISTWNEDVRLYLNKEARLGRIFKLDTVRPNTAHFFICAKIISIKESKIDQRTGEEYSKLRHVYNNTRANQFMQDLGFLDEEMTQKFKFSTPTAEVLFLYDELYALLCHSDLLSCYDKAEFYRQFYVAPTNWHLSLIKTADQSWWLDCAGRMGAKNSSIFAQRLSSTLDAVFNSYYKDCGFSTTNQDDSIILSPNEKTNESFIGLCNEFGLIINEAKTQLLRVEVEWAGYLFNQRSKTLKLKKKRLEKIKLSAASLLATFRGGKVYQVTRREVAVFLGCIHSCRPLICGQFYHANPLLFWLRKTAYLFDPFYTDRTLHEEFYNEKISLNSLCIFEIKKMVEIVEAEVAYNNVRLGLNDYLVARVDEKVLEDHDIIFSDSSGDSMGFGIISDSINYSFKIGLDLEKKMSWSINLKELYAALLAILCYLSLNLGGISRKIILYVDNTCAQSILAGRKSNLKSVEIALCIKVLELLCYGRKIIIKRAPTLDNQWADALSRSPKLEDTIELKKLCPFSLLIGVPNPIDHVLKELGLAGPQKKIPNTKKIEQC